MPDSAARPRRRLRRRWLLAAYLLLLLASHVVRWVAPRQAPRPPGTEVVALTALGAVGGSDAIETPGVGRVELVYGDRGPSHGSAAGTTPILLIHGSPGSGEDFLYLAPLLADRWRLLIPGLPGFGASTAPVPDYSIETSARYLLLFLDALEVPRAHLVGFSFGGAVAIEMTAQAPARVSSLTLLSATGAQEFELLGRHELNHALHALQLAAVLAWREGVPHFGLLDHAFLGVPYARSFYDTDQRPLRELLTRWHGPTLILHGERDALVPVGAAREHHRLVPQSDLLVYPAGHFLLFRGADQVARPLRAFLERVEAGSATTLATAPPERQAEAAAPFDTHRARRRGGLGLAVVVLLLALSTLVSEDLACIGGGLLAADGVISLWAASAACAAGIFLGDLLLYAAGRFFGRPAMRLPPLRWVISESALEDGQEWFVRNGRLAILLSRFVPGSRLPTYFGAGLLHAPFWSFTFYLAIASLLWTPLLVGVAYLFGPRVLDAFAGLDRRQAWGFVAAALLLMMLVRVGIGLLSHRGRRLLVGRWLRLRHWEFWPPWMFYPPVLAWIVWLGLRHRGSTLFTAANPAIPAGGFIGESKDAILRGVVEGARAAGIPAPVARWRLIPGALALDEKLERVAAFQREEGLDFPLVLKPDVGQRGSGVVVVRQSEGLDAPFATGLDYLVQEHVSGLELGVFYCRYPDEEQGRVISVTEKRLPVLHGDGERTIEELILDDGRAVAMARLYLHVQRHRLVEVPAIGEPVTLVELGTHCRGAIFLDGAELLSPGLAAALDRLSRAYPGFHFGRYDLRVTDLAALDRGEGFKVLELNGVTAEATHIYDRRNSVVAAWRTLFEQWRLAFEIGAENRRRGCAPTPLRTLWRAWRAYRRQSATHPDSPGPAP